jgi:hypothetical protein
MFWKRNFGSGARGAAWSCVPIPTRWAHPGLTPKSVVSGFERGASCAARVKLKPPLHLQGTTSSARHVPALRASDAWSPTCSRPVTKARRAAGIVDVVVVAVVVVVLVVAVLVSFFVFKVASCAVTARARRIATTPPNPKEITRYKPIPCPLGTGSHPAWPCPSGAQWARCVPMRSPSVPTRPAGACPAVPCRGGGRARLWCTGTRKLRCWAHILTGWARFAFLLLLSCATPPKPFEKTSADNTVRTVAPTSDPRGA